MSGSLFRHEVIEARRQGWLGGISLTQPMSLWITGLGAALAAAPVIALLVFGDYTRRSRVAGQLVPDLGLSTVVAPVSGVVARLLPEEGANVIRGERLVQVDVPRIAASGDDARAVLAEQLDARLTSVGQLATAQAQQLAAQERGQQRQLQGLRAELVQLEQAIATRREQVRLGRETEERYRDVADVGYVSQVQLRQQEQSVLEMLNAQQALERQVTAVRREIARLEQALAELPAERSAAEASARRERALLAQERVQQAADGELLVVAPVAGMVANRFVEPGQAVQPGQALLSLLPEGARLQAQLRVPSSAVGFIQPGDRVQLRYQAYPYQKFGHQAGRVLRVSRSAIPAAAADGSEPYYRVLVELDRQHVLAYGQAEALRPGMLLEADILGESRKLYEWLLEPLYSLRGLAQDAADVSSASATLDG